MSGKARRRGTDVEDRNGTVMTREDVERFLSSITIGNLSVSPKYDGVREMCAEVGADWTDEEVADFMVDVFGCERVGIPDNEDL